MESRHRSKTRVQSHKTVPAQQICVFDRKRKTDDQHWFHVHGILTVDTFAYQKTKKSTKIVLWDGPSDYW